MAKKRMKVIAIVEFDVSDPPLLYYIGLKDSGDVEERAIKKAIELDYAEQVECEPDYEKLTDASAKVTIVDESTIILCLTDAEKDK